MEFGDQRIYASGRCIMFSRKACYFFVRPRRTALEVCVFLGRTIRHPRVRRTDAASRTKIAHVVHVVHRDEVEPPITDWLAEAYETSDTLSGRRSALRSTAKRSRTKRARTRPKR